MPGRAENNSCNSAGTETEKSMSDFHLFTKLDFFFFWHCIWLNDLGIYMKKYFKNYILYLSWLNSLFIILTFCKGQAYDLLDSVSLALGCVLCSWQEFQKEFWSTSCDCPSDLSTAKHSKHSGQVLGYHLIRPVCFLFHFVNGCFCCWLQKQLSFLLSHY